MVMVNQTLVALVNSVLGTGKLTARGNAAYTCPFCKHTKPKLEINFDEESKSYESWHCWVCDKKGKKIHQMFKLIGVPGEKLVELKSIVKTYFAIDIPKQEEKVELPKEFKSLLNITNFRPVVNCTQLTTALSKTSSGTKFKIIALRGFLQKGCIR